MDTSRAPRRPITDRELKAWLAAGAVDRGVGEGLTFVASGTSALAGKASWILRFRLHGRPKEKVLGRYPELSLKDARDVVRQDRARIERGVDVAAAKQAEKAQLFQVPTVDRLADIWLARYIEPRYKYPEVVARVLRRHVRPVLGKLVPADVQPAHIDHVLTRIVAAGAPTVANDDGLCGDDLRWFSLCIGVEHVERRSEDLHGPIRRQGVGNDGGYADRADDESAEVANKV